MLLSICSCSGSILMLSHWDAEVLCLCYLTTHIKFSGQPKCHYRCKGLTMYVSAKNYNLIMLLCQSQQSTSSWACQCAIYRLILWYHRHWLLGVKLTIPKDVFHHNNLGQDSYTALPSALNWVPHHYTYTGNLDINNKIVTYSCQLFFSSQPRDATKLSLHIGNRVLPDL